MGRLLAIRRGAEKCLLAIGQSQRLTDCPGDLWIAAECLAVDLHLLALDGRPILRNFLQIHVGCK